MKFDAFNDNDVFGMLYIDLIDKDTRESLYKSIGFLGIEWDTETNTGMGRFELEDGTESGIVSVEIPNAEIEIRVPKELKGNTFVNALISKLLYNEKNMGCRVDS